MFHTIVLQTPSSAHFLQLKSPDFLHLYVKRLCITFGSMSKDEVSVMLSTCTGIVDLGFWLAWPEGNSTITTTVDKPSMACIISQLPLLRHADLPCEQLAKIGHESLCKGPLPVWCTTLTHLEVLYWGQSSKEGHIVIPLLQHLDALTHLAIDWYLFVPELHERVDVAEFLETKPLLQIVIVDTEKERVPDEHIPIDVRIVYLPSVDTEDPIDGWLGHGNGSKWTKAEKAVERRRRRDRIRREEEETTIYKPKRHEIDACDGHVLTKLGSVLYSQLFASIRLLALFQVAYARGSLASVEGKVGIHDKLRDELIDAASRILSYVAANEDRNASHSIVTDLDGASPSRAYHILSRHPYSALASSHVSEGQYIPRSSFDMFRNPGVDARLFIPSQECGGRRPTVVYDPKTPREDALTLLKRLQKKSPETHWEGKVSMIPEYIPERISDSIDRLITMYRPNSLVVATRMRKGLLMTRGNSKYCLQHSPVPAIVSGPEYRLRKEMEKRKAYPKRDRHFKS
ncbi:hypothetical protein BKA70DRAFT_1433858 [Coprinopsis sp. MPI-PUGE-AT-0042]|nr:hypothetical protein BKA70DRAFT_1433858 [Coprinopsis sp. MPI-PUGE-AT-0042]